MQTEEETPQAEETTQEEISQQPSEQPAEVSRDEKGRFAPAAQDGWVDFPPEAQKKFDRVYGDLRRQQALNTKLIQDNEVLASRLSELEGVVVTGRVSGEEEKLRSAKRQALENGDFTRVMEIDDAIMDLKIKASSIRPEPVKTTARQEPAGYEQPGLDPGEQSAIEEWANARTPDGQLIRPWAHTGHPLHQRATHILEGLKVDPELFGATPVAFMSQMDRLMGVNKPQPVQRVVAKPPAFLAGDQPVRKTTPQDVELTAEQRYYAKKLFPGKADAEERYKEALKRYGTKGRVTAGG